MPKLPKIHGRPLLPWWVYIGYFLLAATIILWNSVAHGDSMDRKRVVIDENVLARAIADALDAHTKFVGDYGDRADAPNGMRTSYPEVAGQRAASPYRIIGPNPQEVVDTGRAAGQEARRLNRKELGNPHRGGKMGDRPYRKMTAEEYRAYADKARMLQMGVDANYYAQPFPGSGVEHPGLSSELGAMGRYGDSELAHVNPFEKAILKALGGSGTTNPKTGYKEYFTDVGVDSAETDRFGGTGDEGFGYSEGEARDTGFYGSEYNPNDAAFNPGLSPAGPPGTPGRSPASETGIRQGLEGFINRNAQFTMMPAGIGLFASKMEDLNNSRFGGNARADFPGGIGGGSRDDAIMGALGAQPVAAPPPAAYAKPAEMTPPPVLGLAGGLSDLQRRAQIATGGSQGQSGVYRTPEAMRYYGNLIARALIGDNGQTSENSNVLPVEQQYLRQVYGINQSDKAAALIDALKPYWSR